MPNEIEEVKGKNPAQILKIALGHASFDNKDIGGSTFSLLDSLSADMIYAGFNSSETTDSIIEDLLEIIQDENNLIAGRLVDEDEDEDEDDADVISIEKDEDDELTRIPIDDDDDAGYDDDEDDEDDELVNKTNRYEYEDDEVEEGGTPNGFDPLPPLTPNSEDKSK